MKLSPHDIPKNLMNHSSGNYGGILTVLTTILVIIGILAGIVGIGVASWSIVTTRRQVREKSDADNIKAGQRKGQAIAAATINHILQNGTDLEDITHRLSVITSRWAKYDLVAYEKQRNALDEGGSESNE